MKFFVDTAEIKDIKELYETGLLDGVTTNPSLIAKSGRDFKEVVREICSIVPGPVSAEVASLEYDGMIAEGEVLAALAENVVVKLPLTLAGLKATKTFFDRGIKTNVTLCFSANQALLAAKVGATYISPFLGRLDPFAQPRDPGRFGRRRCRHHPRCRHPQAGRPPADQCRHRRLPEGLEGNRSVDPLGAARRAPRPLSPPHKGGGRR
jgi:hypothetical protein